MRDGQCSHAHPALAPAQVKTILTGSYARAKAVLEKHRHDLDMLAKVSRKGLLPRSHLNALPALDVMWEPV
jgi:hypothetical protein